ncbi:MAG: hypothetical protein D3909_09320 [Candidatus Electrothrix sp. ATG1]|nr:hypothetical protein [Candidatus Electrothrix sp. ATG1]MCI5209336.1 hypothetical protein [Candidatus Electrothrix sp. ATG2]
MIICIVEQHNSVDSSGVPTDEKDLFVTHAVDLETNNILSLPQVPVSQLDAVYAPSLDAWVINQR